MKNILWILLFFSLATKAQFTKQSAGGAPTVQSTFQGAVGAKKGLVNVLFNDTTTANLDANIVATPGLMILAGDSVYVRSQNASKWVLVNGMGVTSGNVPDSLVQTGSVYCWFKGGVSTCWDLGRSIDSLPLNWNKTFILHYNNGVKLPDSTELPHTNFLASGRIILTPDVPNPGDVTIGWDSSGFVAGGGGGGLDSITYNAPHTVQYNWYHDGHVDSVQYVGDGGGAGGGVKQLGTGYGLINVDDSTYKIDSAVIATRVRLINELALKQNTIPTGTTAQYFRGDFSLATIPAIPAQVNPIAGTNVTITGTYPNLTFNASITSIKEELTATAGQTAFAFTVVPTTATKYNIMRNGMVQPTSAYGVAGNTVTFIAGLDLNDIVTIQGIN